MPVADECDLLRRLIPQIKRRRLAAADIQYD